MSVSKDELLGAYRHYIGAVTRAGVDVSNYRLQFGDSANSYRVLDGGGGGLGFGSYGYVGDTRATAYRALYVAASVLDELDNMNRRAVLSDLAAAPIGGVNTL